jgi:hypothetical protein
VSWPTGLGAVVAVVVLVLAILLALGVLPFTPLIVGILIALVAAARLL